ncbi:MAG: tetratricopeptide repeat-containing sensor histidine kinase [Flavobacteriales bacterium]
MIKYVKMLVLLLGAYFCTSCEYSKEEFSPEQYEREYDALRKQSPDASLFYVDSLLLSNQLTEKERSFWIYKKGLLKIRFQKDQEAYDLLEKAYGAFEDTKFVELKASILYNMGSSQVFLNNKTKGTELLFQALKLAQDNNLSKMESWIYGSLAQVKYLNKDIEGSVDYINQSIKIQEEIKDTNGLSATYNNLAILYRNMGIFNKALEYNYKSLGINEQLNSNKAIAKSYNNIAIVHEQIGNYDMAVSFFKKAIDYHEKEGSFVSSPWSGLGNLFLKQKEFKTAKKYFSKGLKIEEQSMVFFKQKGFYDKLLELSILEKDFESALIYQQRRDSVGNLQIIKENEEKILQVEKQHQLFKTASELDQVKERNNKNRIIFIGIFGSLILIMIIVYLRVNNKVLKNLQEKKDLEQKVLRSQMNPHFIFNALSAIQNSLMDNQPLQSATYLSRFAKLIRQNFDFIQEKSIPLSEELDALNNYIETQQIRFKNKFVYTLNVHENIDIDIIQVPPLLLQPFIENSIEHGFKNLNKLGELNVDISGDEEIIHYQLSDNGSGISKVGNDGKTHSTDVFLRRLKLLGNKDEETFRIETGEFGTVVSFSLRTML